jgi:hypothetical protein
MKLRLPEAMRERIAELAKQNGRSMNAEIVRRLEWALTLESEPVTEKKEPLQQPVAGALSWLITTEIKALAEKEGVPFDEMLAKIVVAGLHPEAPQVLYLPLFPGTTKEDVRNALQASKEVLRPDAAVVSESLENAPWAPEWMVERLRQPDFITQTGNGKVLIVETKTTRRQRLRSNTQDSNETTDVSKKNH